MEVEVSNLETSQFQQLVFKFALLVFNGFEGCISCGRLFVVQQ